MVIFIISSRYKVQTSEGHDIYPDRSEKVLMSIDLSKCGWKPSMRVDLGSIDPGLSSRSNLPGLINSGPNVG
jgi:hypothetical protein